MISRGAAVCDEYAVADGFSAPARRAHVPNQQLEDQAALRRVATLVARGAPTAEVVPVVAAEVGSLLGATDNTVVVRLDADGLVTVVSSAGGDPEAMREGTRWRLDPQSALAGALAAGRFARCDDYDHIPRAFAAALRGIGVRCEVAIPIIAGTRRWGALAVSTRGRPFPADTEQRLAEFAELIEIALGNAENAAQLAASRARVMAASDQARRRIERDLHDGAQQRLVMLGLELRLLQASVPPRLPELCARLGELADQVSGLREELRNIARGIHPAILSQAGLGAALRALSRRSVIPVQLDIRAETRFPDAIEVAAYFVVSEALTNMVKHADASNVTITVEQRCQTLLVAVQDDGVGGADPTRGSGLVGIRDRAEALGGTVQIASPPGAGTLIDVRLPL